MRRLTSSELNWSLFVALALVLIGQCVWIALGRSLTVDEAVTLTHSYAGLHGSPERLLADIHMPFYNLVVALGLGVLGFTAPAAKIVSMIAATGCLLVLFVFARRWAGEKVALVACAWLATSPFFVEYGQTARSYALFAATAALSTDAYLRLSSGRVRLRSKVAWYYILATVAMLGSHMVGVAIVAMQALHFAFEKRGDRREGAKIFAVVAAIYAPVPMVILNRYDLARDIPTIYSWVREPTLASLASSVGPWLEPNWIITPVLAILLGVALYVSRDAVTRLLALWALGPALILFAYSHLHHPVFIKRGLLPSVVPLVLLGARGLMALESRARFAVWGVAVAIAGAGLVENVSSAKIELEEWRALASDVKVSTMVEGGVAVFVRPAWAAGPFAYYFAPECFFSSDLEGCLRKMNVHVFSEASITGGAPYGRSNWFVGYGSEAETNLALIEALEKDPQVRITSRSPIGTRGFDYVRFTPVDAATEASHH